MSARYATLGDVAEFINGAAFKPEDWGEAGARIIRIQNLTDDSKPYNRTLRAVDPRLQAQPGDLLVSWSATLGVFEWFGPDVGLVNQHIFRVVPDLKRVDKRYLRHVLSQALLDMQHHLHGATMQHVNRREFLATNVYLPPLLEQRRIASILDAAESRCSNRRAAIAKLETLSQSIFLEMFGDPVANPFEWPRLPFRDLLDRIESGWSPVCLDRPKTDEEWGVLKLGAVTWCEFDPRANKALPSNVQPDPDCEVRPGDLLFARKNTYELVGACALVRATPPRLMLSDLMFRLKLRGDTSLATPFLQQLLIYPTKRAQVQRLAGGSAGSMPNISKAKLESIWIELPPMFLQHDFASRVEKLGQLARIHSEALSELDALIASLQHRAFRGEL